MPGSSPAGIIYGGLAERVIAAVLKIVDPMDPRVRIPEPPLLKIVWQSQA